MSELLVGIGLNVETTPVLPAAGAELALDVPLPTTLGEILGREVPLTSFRPAFVAAFERAWSALPLAQTLAAYEEFATGAGQPWVGVDDAAVGVLKREMSVAATGELPLAAMAAGAGEVVRLASAEHRFSWAYNARGREKFPVLVADCGNTRIKLALYVPAVSTIPTVFEALDAQPTPDALAAAFERLWPHVPARGWPLFIASVNPAASAALSAAATRAGVTPVAIPKRRLRTWGDHYALAQLGIDRLAAMEGAMVLLAQAGGHGRDAVGATLVIGCGTALTIDALRADGFHLGGVIAPGLSLSLDSLHRATGLLPQLRAAELGEDASVRLGRDTRSAMLAGVSGALLGAIEGIERALAAEGHAVVARIMTGGDALLLAPAVPGAQVVPSLVLDGARAMALG